MVPMAIDVSAEGDAVRLAVRGEIDLETVPALEEAIHSAQESSFGDIVVDLEGVTFIGSSGIAALVVAHRTVAVERRRLRVVNIGPTASRVFEVAGVRACLTAEAAT